MTESIRASVPAPSRIANRYDVQGSLGPAKFDKAAFALGVTDTASDGAVPTRTMTVHMKYKY